MFKTTVLKMYFLMVYLEVDLTDEQSFFFMESVGTGKFMDRKGREGRNE